MLLKESSWIEAVSGVWVEVSSMLAINFEISKRQSGINVYRSLFYTKFKIHFKNWPYQIGCPLYFSINYQFENNSCISQHNLAFKFHNGLVQLQSKKRDFEMSSVNSWMSFICATLFSLAVKTHIVVEKESFETFIIACKIWNLLDFPK